MASTTASATRTTNGSAAPAAPESRRLPDGVSGMLVVGLLRHVAQSKRSEKQLLFDVETVDAEGRIRIESLSGWLMEAGEGGGFTSLGQLFAGGHLGKLIGHEVCIQVSARAAVTKSGAQLYVTCEGIWPLDPSAVAE